MAYQLSSASIDLNEHPLGAKFSSLSDEIMKLGHACRTLRRAVQTPTSDRATLLQIINDHSEAHALSRRVMELLRTFQSDDAGRLNKSDKVKLFHLSQKYQDQLKILNDVSKQIESSQKEWILSQLATSDSVEMQELSNASAAKLQSPEMLEKMKLKALATVEQSGLRSGYSLDPGSSAPNKYLGSSHVIPKYTVHESQQMLEEAVRKDDLELALHKQQRAALEKIENDVTLQFTCLFLFLKDQISCLIYN
jgi:hypothetical protein